MKREASILILQDRSVGLESRQDDLRRLQVFSLFAYVSNASELTGFLKRAQPDAVILVTEFFELSLSEVQSRLMDAGCSAPIITIVPASDDILGMSLLRAGAFDFLAADDLDRLGPSLFNALRASSTTAQAWAKVEPKDITYSPVVASDQSLSHQSAEALLQSLLDIVTELDVFGTILYESASVKRILGYEQAEIIGRNAFSLIHPLDIPRVMPVFMLGLASPGVPHSVRFRFKHKDGTWRWLESVGTASLSPEGQRKIVVTSRDITERQDGPKANLGDSELRFMAVVEGLGEGVLITDRKDKILYANKRMSEISGYAVSELLGSITYELFLPEAYWEAYREQKDKWLGGGQEEYELAIMRKDHSPLCTHINISPNLSATGEILGLLMAFTDITNRKEAEAEVERAFAKLEERVQMRTSELSESRERLRSMAEAMPQMVWVTDSTGSFEYANKRSLEYIGLDHVDSEMHGSSVIPPFVWDNLVHVDDLENCSATWSKAVETGTTYEIEYRLRKASSGEYRWHIGRAVPMKDEFGKIQRWFGTCTDIHDLKLVEGELLQSQALLEKRVEARTHDLLVANQILELEIEERRKIEEDLRKAKDRAEVMNRLKTSFLANMSHEIRTPLTSILGFASVLSDGLAGTDMVEFPERIEKSGQRLLATMNAIMDLSRSESKEMEFNIQPVHLEAAIAQCIDQIFSDAALKNIIVEKVPHGETYVMADEHYLCRAMHYMLNNAVKFTQQGSISVAVSKKSKPNRISLSICDTGIGISADFLPHIFDEFKQESSGYGRDFEGTGLGLTLAKRFIEAMGGSLEVESTQGVGSCFTINLQLAVLEKLQPVLEPAK